MAGAVIGALRVNIGADTGQFEDGLKKASSSLKSFGATAGAVAGGLLLAKAIEKTIEALGDLVAATFKSVDAMDRMGKEAQKLGITTEAMSQLSVAATTAGVDVTTLATSMVKLSKGMVEANEKGTDPLSRGLQSLGINARNTSGQFKTSAQLTAEVADKFSQYRDGVEKTTVATLLFGETGAKMIPILNQGREGLQRSSEMAAKLGLVMSTEASQAASKFNENMKLVGLGLTQGIFNAIAEKVLPALVKLSDFLLNVTVGFLNLIGVSRDTVKALEDLRNGQAKLNVVTQEAAQKAAQFREKMLSLQVATASARGQLSQFPEGFVQLAMSMGLVSKNMDIVNKSFSDLTKNGQLLFVEMVNLANQNAALELMPPWERLTFTMNNLNVALAKGSVLQEEFRLKSIKASADAQKAYGDAAAGIAGSLGEMFTAIGGDQKDWVRATKIAMAAQALFSAYAGSAAALQGPFPANLAAAALVLAKGLTLVAAIKGTPLGFAQGGSFMVPGAGGADSVPMRFMATPGERVTVETPEQQRRGGREINIALQGKSFGFDDVRDLFDRINEGLGDGYRINLARA